MPPSPTWTSRALRHRDGLGPVISNSYGIGEIVLETEDPAELTVENNIFETAAALGISVNFSSGDDGDFSVA